MATHILAQKIINETYVRCPHCDNLVELSMDVAIVVDSPHTPSLIFCSWKCLGRWIIETYEKGMQFEYGLEDKDG